MSKLLAFLSGAACLIWISAWSLWFSGETSRKQANAHPESVAFLVRDDTFHFSGKSLFHFNFSDAIATVDAEGDIFFNKVAAHLNNHPEKQLQLTGTYLPNEQNRTSFANLGVARAESVKALLVNAGCEEERLGVESKPKNNLVVNDEKVFNAVDFFFSVRQAEVSIDSATLVPNQNSNIVTVPDNSVILKYPQKKFNLYDVGGRVVQILDSLRNHVSERSTRKILIIGFSGIDEEASTSFNLAEYRALAVRRYLVDTGLDKRQVLIKYEAGVEKPDMNSFVALSVMK
jgi:OOP family OmpA-OmpF porin